MTQRIPPQNVEAEASILGGILIAPKAIGLMAEILPVEAFYLTAHQHIYRAALTLHSSNQPTDFITVSTWLSDRNLLEAVGGNAQLARLVESTISAANIDRYAGLVLDKYKRRQLIETASEILELGYDTGQDVQSVLEKSEEKIFDLNVNKTDPFQPSTIGDCLLDVFNSIDEGKTAGIPTGLNEFDILTGGMFRKDLIVIAARASMGKTWLACHLANHVAIHEGLPIVFFSSEMSKEQLTKRILAMHSGIDSSRLMKNEVYEDEYQALVKSLEVLGNLPFIIDDTPASLQTPSRIRSVLRRIQSQRGKLGLVVLDYIQKLGNRDAGNRAQAIGKYSGEFKDIAKEFDVPFVALAQINRGVESQSNKRPFMADIKDSGDIEQDMDVGLLLYRDEYYHPDTADKGIMEINVAKNRNGSTGTFKVFFNPSVGSFRNIRQHSVESERVNKTQAKN